MHPSIALNARRRCLRRDSRGVVLVISLIILAVIAISSAVAIRTAMLGDLATNGMRIQTAALQAAETALRYCEDQALVPAPVIDIFELPAVDANNPTAWMDKKSWEGSASRAV